MYTQLKSEAEQAAQIERENAEVAAAGLGGLAELLKWDNFMHLGFRSGWRGERAGKLVGVHRLGGSKTYRVDYKRALEQGYEFLVNTADGARIFVTSDRAAMEFYKSEKGKAFFEKVKAAAKGARVMTDEEAVMLAEREGIVLVRNPGPRHTTKFVGVWLQDVRRAGKKHCVPKYNAVGPRSEYLGRFNSAPEAALARARHVAKLQQAGLQQAEASQSQQEVGAARPSRKASNKRKQPEPEP